ncbi:MAG: type II toxin-antitoxin system VapC family toxin [Desulfovibrionales bacterium]
MNLVDSSGWLEYFAGGPNADDFFTPLKETFSLIVPVVTIYEVFKVILRESSENEAFQAIAAMQGSRVIELTAEIAMNASRLSLQYSLPMADSMILATARMFGCTIWTQEFVL